MKRIATANREVDKFGAGKDGFRAAAPGVSDPTYLSADFCNGVQESIVRVIERAGLEPGDDPDQFVDSLVLKPELGASTGAGLIGWFQSGVGAIFRWVRDKLRERVSVQDFPLTHAGFQAALTACAGKRLIVNVPIILDSTTVPADVSLAVEKGGLITLTAGSTLAINGPFSAGIYQVFASAGVEFPASSVVKAEWWGSGSTAFQRAVNSGPTYSTLKSGEIKVVLSTKQIWADCIDLTTRNYVHIVFKWGVSVVSNSPNYIFDCTSLAYSILEKVTVSSNTARVGIYLNRGQTRPSAEYNVTKNCSINVASNTAANNGNGTIAMYNSRAELFKDINSSFYADCPLMAEKKTRVYLMPIYEVMEPMGFGWDSTTVLSFDETTFHAKGNYSQAMYVDDVLGLECKNCYWVKDAVVNGTNLYAIFSNNLFRAKFSGSCEQWPAFLQSAREAQFLDIDIAMQGNYLTTTGVINVDSVGADVGGLAFSDVNVIATGAPTAGACVVYGSRGYNNTSIRKNKITSNIIPINTVDKTLRLNGAVIDNIENGPGGLRISNVREYATIGAYVANGVSLAYVVPVECGYAEITAAYRLIGGGSAEQQTVTLIFTRWNGGAGQIILKSSGSIGAANRITYALAGSTITFSCSANTGTSFIGYQIKESYGDAG